MLKLLSIPMWARRTVLQSRRKKKATPCDVTQIIEALENRTLLSAITVNSIEDNVTAGDGLVTLREAIIAANSDGTTDLGDTGSGADTITFDLGGGTQTITLLLGQLLISSEITIVGSGANQLTISGNGTSRIFEFTFSAIADLSGLRLTDGFTLLNGGAIQNAGQLTLSAMQIDGNTGSGGGGIFNTGTLNISNSSIDNNEATSVGGGVMNMASGIVNITYSSISNNRSRFDGGGIVNLGTISLFGSTISGNASGADGGGIVNIRGGSVTIAQGTVVSNNNAASDSGGLFNDTGSTAIVTDSLFVGNTANDFAGAIRNLGNLEVYNSTISGNSAGTNAGGLYNTGSAKFVNATIFENIADSDGDGFGVGGGIWQSSFLGFTLIDNTIVAGNLSGTSASDIVGTLVSISSFNLIGDAGSSGGLVDGVNGNIVGTTPLLGPLEDNGGPTFTHALLEGSAAIDAGSNALAVDANGNPIEFDQRGTGFARIQNGTVDIGAFEAETIDRNNPPEATDDGFTTTEDSSLTMDVLANDSDPDGDSLTVVFVSQPTDGTVTMNEDNTISYTPNTNFSGTDTFTYEISDGNGGTATATVSIAVLSVQQQLKNLKKEIIHLMRSRELNFRQGISLVFKLNGVGLHLKYGRTNAALNQLRAFDNQVRAFVQSGILSNENGQKIFDATEDLKTGIETGRKDRKTGRDKHKFGFGNHRHIQKLDFFFSKYRRGTFAKMRRH